jgi:hypothetical protein
MGNSYYGSEIDVNRADHNRRKTATPREPPPAGERRSLVMAVTRKRAFCSWCIALASLVGVIGSPAAAHASDLPEPAAWMPAEASFILYLDVAALISSSALGGIEDSLVRQISPEGLDEFRELTGMDPWRDFQAVCLFTQSESEGEADGDGDGEADADAKEAWGVAISGAFDPERVIESLDARGRLERSKHRDTVLYTLASLGLRSFSGAEPHALAFPDGSTALVGTSEAVRKMLDVGYGFSPSAVDGKLARSLDELSMGETVWAVSAGGSTGSPTVGSGTRTPGSIRDEIGSVESFVLSARVGSDIKVRAQGESRNEADATKLTDLVRGLVAIATLSAEAGPPAVDDLEVETERNQWSFSFAIDGRAAREWFLEKKKRPEAKDRPAKSR